MSVFDSSPTITRHMRLIAKTLRRENLAMASVSFEFEDGNLDNTSYCAPSNVIIEGHPTKTLRVALKELLNEIIDDMGFDYISEAECCLSLIIYRTNRYELTEHYKQLIDGDDGFYEDEEIPPREDDDD